MATHTAEFTKKIRAEVARTPPRYRPQLLKLVHSFREAVTQEDGIELSPADSLRQSLREVKAGNTRSITGLWARAGL